MKDNNELIIFLYQNSKMGVDSTKKLLELIKDKDNKIKTILEEELDEYEKFLKRSEKLLKKHNVNKIEVSIFASMGANIGMSMDINKDNSDSNVAALLTKGFTMGIIDLTKKIDNYKTEVKKDIIKIAKESLKFQNEQIKILKDFL